MNAVSDRDVKVAIRAMKPADLESIESIEQASFSDPWSKADFREVSRSPHCIFLAGEAGAEIVGYAIAMFVADESEILNIAVGQSHRGKGFGGALLDGILEQLRERNVESVFLEVRESNDRAKDLYHSRGFTAVSKRKKYYRNPVEDALILRLALKG